MRSAALFLLFLFPLRAQFADFAVTDDGRLFFTTTLGTGQEDARSKAYLVTSSGIFLFGNGGGDPFSGTIVVHPFTSGDGAITGFGLNSPCRTGSCALFVLPRTSFRLQGLTLANTSYDNLEISRNARFLFGRTYDLHARRIDLQTQQTIELPQYLIPTSTAQAISNSGTMLVRAVDQQDSLLQVLVPGKPSRTIPGTEDATNAIISPDDARIVYERRTGGSAYELWMIDLAAGTQRLLASTPMPASFVYHPSFSNDGTLAYLAFDPSTGTAQPMLCSPSSEPRSVVSIEEGVQNSIISGNAEIVWLLTASGRLLRVRIADRGIDVFIPATPFTGGANPAFPGSIFRLIGSGLSSETQVILNQKVLPVTEFSAKSVTVQLPWEFPLYNTALSLSLQNPGNPFHQSLSFSIFDRPTITFERLANVLQAAHQDFRGVLTADDPALPGEIIHVFARNLGPVDTAIPTGQPSPSDPPARVTTPLACYLSLLDADGNPVKTEGLVVPFAGLSGGSIGVYQLDVIIPAAWTASKGYLQCRMGYLGDTGDIPIGSAQGAAPGRL